MKLITATIIFAILCSFATSKTISYRQLNWKDFKGKPDSRGVALTTSQIYFETNYSNGKYYFLVSSQFIPEKSFTTTTKERILRHEQLHFDITELIVRRLKEQLKSVTTEKEANALFSKYVKQWNELEQQYDRETNFSINQEQQERWEREIKDQLR
jgi:hypothetical protein